jgi:hypothetical protein
MLRGIFQFQGMTPGTFAPKESSLHIEVDQTLPRRSMKIGSGPIRATQSVSVSLIIRVSCLNSSRFEPLSRRRANSVQAPLSCFVQSPRWPGPYCQEHLKLCYALRSTRNSVDKFIERLAIVADRERELLLLASN